MSRRIPIVSVEYSSPGVPATFTIGAMTPDAPAGDWRSVFQGKFFRQPAAPVYYLTPFGGPAVWTGTRHWWDSDNDTVPDASPTDTPPAGYELVTATVFDVVENASFAGRYTVFTKGTAGSMLECSEYSAGQTLIRVAQPITGSISNPDKTGTGYITNVSTYLLVTQGTTGVIIPPKSTITDFAIDFNGRDTSGWGEVNAQSHLSGIVHFCGTTAPSNPFTGMLWYNHSTNELKVRDGGWNLVNAAFFSPAASFEHTEVSPSLPTPWTFTVTHGLSSPHPAGIVMVQVFVNDGSATKPILPQDITFVDANTLSITLSASTGYTHAYVLVRP